MLAVGAGGLGSRQGLVSGPSPRADAGTALAGSGSGVGEDASSLFPLPGIMNTIVGSFQSTSVGVAKAEQIGVSKVTNIGQTEMINVGKQQNLTIGKTQSITIGEEQNTNIGKSQGTVVGEKITVNVGKLYGLMAGEKFRGESKVWEVYAEDKIFLSAPGGYIEINKTGIRLYALKIDLEGNQINFKKGGPGEPPSCLRQMSKSSTPFVRM